MTSTQSQESPGTVIGNHTKKYTAKNPAIRYLTERWVDRLDGLVEQISHAQHPATNPLEVGAGEGVISQKLYQRFGSAVGIDLPDAGLRSEWRERPGPHYLHADAEKMPFLDNRSDLWLCGEVLEPPRTPEAALRELARVSSRHLLLSVPREPIFRSCNLVTG